MWRESNENIVIQLRLCIWCDVMWCASLLKMTNKQHPINIDPFPKEFDWIKLTIWSSIDHQIHRIPHVPTKITSKSIHWQLPSSWSNRIGTRCMIYNRKEEFHVLFVILTTRRNILKLIITNIFWYDDLINKINRLLHTHTQL